MERAERRRNAKNEKKEKKATYNLTIIWFMKDSRMNWIT